MSFSTLLSQSSRDIMCIYNIIMCCFLSSFLFLFQCAFFISLYFNYLHKVIEIFSKKVCVYYCQFGKRQYFCTRFRERSGAQCQGCEDGAGYDPAGVSHPDLFFISDFRFIPGKKVLKIFGRYLIKSLSLQPLSCPAGCGTSGGRSSLKC